MEWARFNPFDFFLSFLSILFEGVPFVLAGTLLSGAIDAFVPARLIERLLPRRGVWAVFAAGLLPLLLPMCECGVVPVVRRLLRKGLPPACAVTYLLAAPIVNPVVIASTLAAFSGQGATAVAAARAMLGYGVAVLAGLGMWRFGGGAVFRLDRGAGGGPWQHGGAQAERHGAFGSKAASAVRCAAGDFLEVSAYLVIGAAVTSLFNTAVDQSLLAPLSADPVRSTATMMCLAFLLSLCSTSDAFVAATLAGFSLAARLAFLVYGPMCDLKLMLLYRLLFRRRVIAIFAVALFVWVGVCCLALGTVPWYARSGLSR